jgi:cellulose synthase/poly-beta-1,6-N-acetylglucosamine synthase-like glycosyltransferase
MNISVVIPAYNVETYICEALDSALRQERAVSEIVVVDDASMDETLSIVRSFADARREIPIRLFQNEQNKGVSFTRNRGIFEAKSEWIAFLDPDDRWLPQHTRLAMEALSAGADFTYGWLKEFGDESQIGLGIIRPGPWERRTWPVSYFRRPYIYPSALCARKAALDALGGFPESAHLGEDWMMMVRAILREMKVVEVPTVVCAMRKHSSSATAGKGEVMQRWLADQQPVLEEYPILRKYRTAEHYRQRGYWTAYQDPFKALALYVRAIRLDPMRLNLWLRLPLLLLMCARLERLIPPPLRFLRPPEK